MEKILQDKLNIYNETVENKYRERWGSTLAFLGATHKLNGRKVDEVEVFTRINEFQEQLKVQKSTAEVEKERREFMKKYGVTRAHVPNGRPVPRNQKEEQLYEPLDKNIIIAQHGLRKQTDDQMRNIAKIEDLRKRPIVDQAQINVIQTRMRSKEVNTGFKMQVPGSVPKGQRIYPRSSVRDADSVGQVDLQSQTSTIKGRDAQQGTRSGAHGQTKTIGWASDRFAEANLGEQNVGKKIPGINLIATLGPLKADAESEDLGQKNRNLHSRHQRNMTLGNADKHKKLLNLETQNDKHFTRFEGHRHSQDVPGKTNATDSRGGHAGNTQKTTHTTAMKSGQHFSPQNILDSKMVHGFDDTGEHFVSHMPKTSIDKGVMNLQSTLRSKFHGQDDYSEEGVPGSLMVDRNYLLAKGPVPPFTLADKVQAHHLGRIQEVDGSRPLLDGSSSQNKQADNYKQGHEISVAKRLMMQKLGGRASTSDTGFRQHNKYRTQSQIPSQFRSGALHTSQSLNRGISGSKDFGGKSGKNLGQSTTSQLNQAALTEYVNINHRREIHLNYAANNAKSKKNTRANHVFNLQCTSRLAHKFTGSTTLQGKKEHQIRMIVEPGKHGTFEEQEEYVKNIVDKSKSKVVEQINQDISVKQNNVRSLMNAIISGEGEKVGINPEKYRFALNMDLSGKDGHGDKVGKPIQTDKTQSAVPDIQSIGAHNKLQIAIIKHSEFVKQKVSDDFSKAKDPIDQYNEINELAEIIGRQDAAEMNKKQKQQLQDLKAAGMLDQVSKEQQMKQFYEKRSIHERTPRRFDEIKGQGNADLFYDPHKKDQKIPETLQNKDVLKKRQYQVEAIQEINVKKENEDHAKLKIHKMPLELRLILDVDPEEQNKIYRLMGLTSLLFLKMNDIRAFMAKRKFSTEQMEVMIKNVKFSKEFFNIMDDDGAGGICLEELAQPLIALGLATDTGFVRKSLKALNPSKFGAGKCEDAELTIKEFSRIFRTDSVSEKLIKQIKKELLEQDLLKEQQALRKEQHQLECLCKHYMPEHDHQHQSGQTSAGAAGANRERMTNMFDPNIMTQQQFSMMSFYEDQTPIGFQPHGPMPSDAIPMDIRQRHAEDQGDYSEEDQFEKTRQSLGIADPRAKAMMMQAELQTMNIQQQLQRQRAMDEEMAKNLKKIEEAHNKKKKEKFRERHKKFLEERGLEYKGEKPAEKKNKKVHDINDQVQVVQKWWEQMQKEDLEEQREKGFINAAIKQQLPLSRVVKKFVQWKIFQDQTSARRYLLEHDADYDDCEEDKDYFEFNDFLAIFLKGIFKDVVCGIANTAQNFRRQDQQHIPLHVIQQRSLLWKLSDYKRENLFDLLAKGQIKSKDDPQKIVKRPIFTNLYNLKYRTDPEKWQHTKYEDFLNETINKEPDIEDPFEQPLDTYDLALNFIGQDFSKEIEQFEKIKGYNVKPEINNLQELEKYFEDLVKHKIDLKKSAKLDSSEDDQSQSTQSQEQSVREQGSEKVIQSSQMQTQEIDVIELMYPGDKKKERFELNNEKRQFSVKRQECPSNIVDTLSKQERLDQQKKLIQDMTIEKHHNNLKRLILYNKPEYQTDPLFEQKFEQMIQMGLDNIDKITAADLPPHTEAPPKKDKAMESATTLKDSGDDGGANKQASNKLFKIINDVRKMNKDKYDLLHQCHENMNRTLCK